MNKVQKFLSLNHNFTQLIGIFGTVLCRLMNVVVLQRRFSRGRWVDHAVDPCKPSGISWLGLPPALFLDKEAMCVQLGPGVATFSRSSESLIVTQTANALYNFDYELNATGYIYVNFHDDFVSVESHNVLWIPVGSAMGVDIIIAGHYKEISSSSDACGFESLAFCYLQCRMSFIVKFCRCKPLSFRRFWHLDLPVCGHNISISPNESILGRNPQCLLVHRETVPDKACSRTCKRPCDYKIFSFSTYDDKSVKKKYHGANVTTIISFSVDPFTYPLIEEFPIMTYRQFIAAIGGNFNFYLGINFISLLHIIIFLFKLIFKYGKVTSQSVSVDLSIVTVE